jgi:hypothetical protein
MNTPEIKTNNNYNQFEMIVGNRNLNVKKIERIIEDIKNGVNLLPYCPIIVYEDQGKLKVIDGQHRFEVCKKIESPVYYVQTKKMDLKKIALLNSRQDKWTEFDFLRCYIKIGIEDYKTLEKVMRKYQISISTAYSLLMVNKVSARGEIGQLFRDGEFKINYYQSTSDLLDLTQSIFDRYKFHSDRHLISAIQLLEKKGLCDFNHLRSKVKEAPMLMDKQGTVKDYIYNIERVYNHKKKERQIIF